MPVEPVVTKKEGLSAKGTLVICSSGYLPAAGKSAASRATKPSAQDPQLRAFQQEDKTEAGEPHDK